MRNIHTEWAAIDCLTVHQDYLTACVHDHNLICQNV